MLAFALGWRDLKTTIAEQETLRKIGQSQWWMVTIKVTSTATHTATHIFPLKVTSTATHSATHIFFITVPPTAAHTATHILFIKVTSTATHTATHIFRSGGWLPSRSHTATHTATHTSPSCEWSPLRCGWVFLERTRILNGIQFARLFVEFVVVETKRFVSSNVNVILMRQTCSQRSSMSAGSKCQALEKNFFERICYMFLISNVQLTEI